MLRLLISALSLMVVAAASAAEIDPYPSGHQGHFGLGHHGHGNRWALPVCDEPSVLAGIAERFAYADARLLHTGLAVERVDDIHQHAIKSSGPSLIDRRYCGGFAWLSDGRRSEVVYLIEAGQGFASHGWNVESCLPAYDPGRVYGAKCRSVRP